MKNIDIVLENKQNAKVLLTAFQTMLDHSTDMMFIKDINGIYLGATVSFVQMVGKQSVEDIIDRSDFELFEDEDLAKRYTADDRKLLESGRNLIDFVEPLAETDGHARYASTSKYILSDADGNAIGILGICRDITKDLMAQQNHQRELEYLFELPEDAYGAIYIDINDWRVISELRQPVNGHTIPLYETIGALVDNVIQNTSDRSEAHTFYRDFSRRTLMNIFESGKRLLSLEYLRKMDDGTLRWTKNNFKFLSDPATGHPCAMIVIRDIDTKKQAAQQLLQAAETDEMTGLLNRSATMKHIRNFLSDDGKHGHHALLIVDVDNFKEINDNFGHQAGDKFLTDLAQALRRCFRCSDIVGRIGGDEFFVLIKDIPSQAVVAEKTSILLGSMQHIREDQAELGVSCSIGISLYPEDGVSLDQLYARADQALYQAKRTGKKKVIFAKS